MPVADEIKSSWADEVELDQGAFPPPSEIIDNGVKVVTEYKCNDDDKKVKIVRTYKIERRVVSKSIAKRKTWAKFGDSADDKPGPNPATTMVSEDVYMQFITSKEESSRPEDSELDGLKAQTSSMIFKCRTCQGDHWTLNCPFKHTQMAAGKTTVDSAKVASADASKTTTGGSAKYVAPFLREGARRDAAAPPGRRDDVAAIRISNLSNFSIEADLEDLVKGFGPVQKLYLAKEKSTGLCKGFAYVHFKFRQDAAKAIQVLNGYGYDHLILNVEWSKPPQNN